MVFKFSLKGVNEKKLHKACPPGEAYPNIRHPCEEPNPIFLLRYTFKGNPDKIGHHHLFASNLEQALKKSKKVIENYNADKFLSCRPIGDYTYNPKTKKYILKPMLKEV